MSKRNKRCRSCRRSRALALFALERKARGGRRGVCRECDAKRAITPNWRAADLVKKARVRASKAGHKCSLTKDWALSRLEAGRCEVTGIPFNLAKGRHPRSPSIDRKNASRGYTKRNCRLVISQINMALGEWGDDSYTALTLRYLMVALPEIVARFEGKRLTSIFDESRTPHLRSAWL